MIPDTAFAGRRGRDDKLGEDTVILAMGDLLGVTASTPSWSPRDCNDRQVRALVEEVERRVK